MTEEQAKALRAKIIRLRETRKHAPADQRLRMFEESQRLCCQLEAAGHKSWVAEEDPWEK
jgi:hypothetical protein